MPQFTRPRPHGKAAKPYPDFPLTPHPSGRWCKKIKGKLHYFGPISDPNAALTKWERERDYLLTGRTPPVNPEGVTIRLLCNSFLAFKDERVATGELSRGMRAEYQRATDAIVATFGLNRLVSDLDASDFGRLRQYLAKGRGLVALHGLIRKCKIAFKWGYDSGLLDRPPRYGQSFAPPSRATLRKERIARGRLDYSAEEIRKLLKAAEGPMRAYLLLGINCAFGSGDIGALPFTAINLKDGWIDFPRPKTAIARRIPLWPETSKAIRDAIENRAKPKSEQFTKLAFLTPRGNPLNRGDKGHVDYIASVFKALCAKAGIEQAGRGFYSLRRTTATVGDGFRDPVALRHIMGHSPMTDDMGDVYRQAISDDRLQAVVEHVRQWLFPRPRKAK